MPRGRRVVIAAVIALLVLAGAGGWAAHALLVEPSRTATLQSSERSSDEDHADGAAESDDDAGESSDEDDDEHGSATAAADDERAAQSSRVRVPSATFVPAVRKARATMWAVGDGGDDGAAAKALAGRIARGPIDRLLYLGDVYDWSGPAGFAHQYGGVYGRLARLTAPTPGNHEDPVAEGYDPFWQRVTGTAPPSFYAFTAAGWEILSLNSEIDHGPGSPQLRWLRGRLRGPGTCRVAIWHRPRYSAGTEHGDQPDTAPLWEALRGHAAIVLNGHEHDMQRFKPIDGIVEFVSGAGGHSHYAIDRRDARLAFADDSNWGALRLELERGTARYAFVADDGRTLDAGTVRCR